MNIILLLILDRDNTILIEKEDDAVSVLQTSCMLQFNEIKSMCIERLIHTLSPSNCIRIWLFAEQLDLKSLCLKAKSMALTEFHVIKDSEIIMDFNLNQLHAYLANTSLQCKSELDVFQVCMKWWYDNSEKLAAEVHSEHLEAFNTGIFMNLLLCLDFNRLCSSDIQEIMTYPDLSKNGDITKVLQCKAEVLCKCKSRHCKQLPCIYVHNIPYEPAYKKSKLSSLEKETVVVYYDSFKRKRYYADVEWSESTITVVYHDEKKNGFTKLLTIGKQKCDKLEGCHILGYKELIFLFGGEFVIGYGNWNKNLWVYNTVTDCWQRKSVMPFARRHFQSCIVENCLYIIGGTGNYRILQENMFSYDYKEDRWSQLIKLPCCERQTKCCSWNDELFVFNVNEKCAYIFDKCRSSWTKMIISDKKHLVMSFPSKFSVFSHKDSVYIKGESLIELKRIDQQLTVIKCIPLNTAVYDEINSIVCGDIIYTLYKQPSPDIQNASKTLSFEKYCITTGTIEFVFIDKLEGSLIEFQGDNCAFKMSTILFGLQHYELVATDDFVNNMCI
ncbi:hypothetical protein ILUMI_24895 [Ignelater luminosus]|uniref:BACK domain-containing protein n=1 Tax=Ignelater luminosus TaxID=2038154 RepID=A0A8K0C9M0_IGNLU|nr:hypothetical protein ILUMI_24895 [Ignelater luminosus]